MANQRKLTPELLKSVREWLQAKDELGNEEIALKRWREQKRKIGNTKRIADHLGVSPSLVYTAISWIRSESQK